MKDTLQELYNKYKDIEYGWYDGNNQLHLHVVDGFLAKFKMQTIEHIKETKNAICWEVVELYRHELEEKGINCETYFFCLNETGYHCHSIIVVPYDNKYYWIEGSFKDFKGVHEYDTLDEIFDVIKNNYHIIVRDPKKKVNKDHIRIYRYTKPKDGIGCFSFYMHCFSNRVK